MSLNWREIQCVLEELPLRNSFIQKIHQPDFRHLVLIISNSNEQFPLLLSLHEKMIRLNMTHHRLPVQTCQQRFLQLLKAHIEGGKILCAEQMDANRIVKFTICNHNLEFNLWFRMWSGNANILLTDSSNKIYDCFFRKPKAGEISGKIFVIPETKNKNDIENFSIRNLEQKSNDDPFWFNNLIDDLYHKLWLNETTEKLKKITIKKLQKELAVLQKKLNDLRKPKKASIMSEEYYNRGNLLLAFTEQIKIKEKHAVFSDYENNLVKIPINPDISIIKNAELYFTKAKKNKKYGNEINQEIENVEHDINIIMSQIDAINLNPQILIEELSSKAKKHTSKKISQGMNFESHGCKITVGRSAKDNDELLRSHVKGNDWWMHARETAGSYVFIRPPNGKSIPLEALLDAGNLAVWYSKARSNGKADLYYTQVKYLKRIKGAKTGKVIPTQERNISIVIDPERIERLTGKKIFTE